MRIKGMSPRIGGMLFIRIAAMALVLAVFFACGMDGRGRSCGTEVHDPDEVAFGCVDHVQGGPAIGVRVLAVPVPLPPPITSEDSARIPLTDDVVRQVETIYTDKLGRFAFGGKLLDSGDYNLIFQDIRKDSPHDQPIQIKSRIRRFANGAGPLIVTLGQPRQVTVRVTDMNLGTPIKNAVCEVKYTTFHELTDALGIAVFYLPNGDYTLTCIATGESVELVRNIKVTDSGAVASIPLFVSDSRDGALSAPDNLTAVYDSVTGFVRLAWSSVKHPQRTGYGLRRVDVGLGGGPKESFVQDTTTLDFPFSDTLDGAQDKHFLYSIYSLRSKQFEIGSRQVEVRAVRPWTAGARIDSIFTLAPDSSYQPGDTARIVAEWHNRIRQNAILYWTAKGSSGFLATTLKPAMNGRDTLAFPVTARGPVEIGVNIRDAGSYLSSDSRVFRFGSP